MPLTPEDVSNKRFTAVRLREGYDMTEVDQFLDEVEAELGRLHRENDALRARLQAYDGGGFDGDLADAGANSGSTADAGVGASADGVVDGDQSGAATLALVKPVEGTQPPAQPAPAPAAAPPAAPTSPPAPSGVAERIQVSTTAEASAAATRLLELATRNADQLLEDAQAQAEQILQAANVEAVRVGQEARSRSDALDTETAARRQQLVGDLQRERDALTTEVESLRTFEREYRTELKSYFHKQLEALDHPLAHTPTDVDTEREDLRA